MLFRKIYFVVFVLLLAIFSACQSDKNMTAATTRVVIISTNDIHAQIDHFPKFATFLKQIRAENPHVLLVDGGDRFSGNVYVDNAKEKGKPMFDLMGKLGYDVATLGNHEFDYGEAALNKRISASSFPVICANMQTKGTSLQQPDPYRIIEKAGIRFCFLGLIGTNAVTHIPATNPDNVKDITFRYYKTAAFENRKLKNQCDVFIGLTHIGFVGDSLLAIAMPELDVIIGGHSHTLIEGPLRINNVLVSQTGSNLKYAGVTYLDFKGKKLVNKTYKAVKLDTFAEDAEIEAMVREICNRPEFKEKIGTTSKGLRYKENVANMVTDAMSEAADCDFAFYNSGGVRYNSIPAGDITRETIYRIEPFNNYIVKHRLTLNEMKRLILNRFNGLKNQENRRIDLFVSKGRYTILKNEEGEGVDVVFVDKNGNKLKDPEQEFTVGLSNYVNSTYDFIGKGKGENTHIPIVEAMEKFVQTQGDVNNQERRTFINKK
ncbi:bifunctional metallophosphatase/5'-nucleotidase [Odoribacter laneus]|uniref:bifunctional metallophosphatase/5'-nucleotidase n=1 Tax=Odoribacter laneus TaxID=626933 RepID=UPI00399388A5